MLGVLNIKGRAEIVTRNEFFNQLWLYKSSEDRKRVLMLTLNNNKSHKMTAKKSGCL